MHVLGDGDHRRRVSILKQQAVERELPGLLPNTPMQRCIERYGSASSRFR